MQPQFDQAKTMYFGIGFCTAFVTAAPTMTSHTAWNIAVLMIGSIGAGLAALKGYTETSQASQQKIAAARAQGASDAAVKSILTNGDPSTQYVPRIAASPLNGSYPPPPSTVGTVTPVSPADPAHQPSGSAAGMAVRASGIVNAHSPIIPRII